MTAQSQQQCICQLARNTASGIAPLDCPLHRPINRPRPEPFVVLSLVYALLLVQDSKAQFHDVMSFPPGVHLHNFRHYRDVRGGVFAFFVRTPPVSPPPSPADLPAAPRPPSGRSGQPAFDVHVKQGSVLGGKSAHFQVEPMEWYRARLASEEGGVAQLALECQLDAGPWRPCTASQRWKWMSECGMCARDQA